MGPKKKKGGKKPSGEKKKKDAGEVLTFKEAVLIYQLEVKQSQINIIKEDFEDLKLRNEKQKQRNLFLKNEQNRHMKDVIDQAREHEKDESKLKQVPYEDVEKALIVKKEAIKLERENLAIIEEEIKKLNEQTKREDHSLKQLKSYQVEHGQFSDQTHIQLLKKEMEDMDMSFSEMSKFFEKSLATIKATMAKENEENVIRHKKDASEKAIENLDERMEQEFIDNKWLLKELAIHREHIAHVSKQIECLQVENMDLISDLFDQQLADVSETRKFYLTCQEDENSDDDNLPSIALDDAHKSLPQNELTWLYNDINGEGDTNNQESCKLDPVEMRLLCVVGKKAPLHDTCDVEAGERNNYRQFVVDREEVLRVKSDSFTN